MSRTKIRGASTFDPLETFCGIQESLLLHCTAKQPPLTSNAISQELLPQQSSLHVRMLVVLRKIEKFPALAPSRSVARYHSRPSFRQFFKSTLFDFELTIPRKIDKNNKQRSFVWWSPKIRPQTPETITFPRCTAILLSSVRIFHAKTLCPAQDVSEK